MSMDRRDDDRHDRGDEPSDLRGVEQLAGAILDLVSDGDGSGRLARALDENIGTDRQHEATTAAATGIALGEDLSKIRDALGGTGAVEPVGGDAGQPAAGGDQRAPPTRVREIQDADGEFVGVRILCSDPGAELMMNVDETSVEIVTVAGREHHPLGFEIGDVEAVESETMSEWVIAAKGKDVPTEDDPEPERPAPHEASWDTDDGNEGSNITDADQEAVVDTTLDALVESGVVDEDEVDAVRDQIDRDGE